VVFALNPQINKQKYAKVINILSEGNKVFVKYQAQGWGLTPTPLAYAYVVASRCLIQAHGSNSVRYTWNSWIIQVLLCKGLKLTLPQPFRRLQCTRWNGAGAT